MKPAGSLRRRLLAGMLAAVALAWLTAVLSAYREARHEVDELLDAHLAQSAALLASQIRHDEGEIEFETPPLRHHYQRKVAFQVWDGPRLLARSASAPGARLSATDEGFSSTESGGYPWRVFGVRHRGATILVAERREGRDAVGAEIAEHLLTPLGIALPLLGLGLAYAIRRGLRPLTRLAAAVAARDPERLESIDPLPAPLEIRPLVDRLNALFSRIRATLAQERRFTADASHELRTPIAAIRAQADVARRATDPEERRHALEQVLRGCDRATHLIEQLLTLARLDAGFQGYETAVDLMAVAAAVLADSGPWAHGRGIRVQLEGEGPVMVRGDATLLGILLRNLVDNAVRYGPAGSTVTVRVVPATGAPRLEIIDQGPGIPVEAREQVLQRFHRLDSTENGSGLGLSIAARIVALFGAHLTLAEADHPPGLRVIIAFPAEAAAEN